MTFVYLQYLEHCVQNKLEYIVYIWCSPKAQTGIDLGWVSYKDLANEYFNQPNLKFHSSIFHTTVRNGSIAWRNFILLYQDTFMGNKYNTNPESKFRGFGIFCSPIHFA